MEINDDVSCVQFTPFQYRRIYYSRLHIRNSDPLDVICLLRTRTRYWQNVVNN